MELWDIYDKDRMKTGRTMVRGSEFAPDSYHMVVHVCIFNNKGEMLIQQRQPFKEGFSNMWDITVGGSATTGDSSQTAAEREVFEEIGLKLDLQSIRPHLTINFDCGFDDIYLVEQDVDIDTLTLQESEVQRVKWASMEEIFAMIDRGVFIPYYKSLIQLMFETRNKYGAHQRELNRLDELVILFRRNFPFTVRGEDTVRTILGNKDCHIIEKRTEKNRLIGAAVTHNNTILMLCVNPECRGKGIGSELLKEAEQAIKAAGYTEVTVGVGFDYLMPGVPTSKRYATAVNECLYKELDDSASTFFEKRGYVHSWDCNCFDMRFPLTEFVKNEHSVGDTVDGILYRFATEADVPSILECTDAACEEFTKYYEESHQYGEDDQSTRVLIALDGDEVVGTLMVERETEAPEVGSVGCTTVKPSHQGRHIAVNMVTIGTKFLRDAGMKDAYLGYTYSGLDHMYGYAGYKICNYYMMAKKEL